MKKVTVSSVIPLEATQKKKLSEALESKYDKITLVEEITPELIGGIKVTIDSTQIDASLSSKLHQLQEKVSSQV